MRESKYDKYIFIISLIAFLYSFFIVGFTPVYESDLEYPERPIWWGDDGRDEVVRIEYPTAIIICPLICIMFLCLILFKDELRPVNRHWVKRKIKKEYQRLRLHCRKGIFEFYRYRQRKK